MRVPRGNMRYVPRRVLPGLCVVPPGAAPEVSLRASRTISEAKERLATPISTSNDELV